MIDAAGLRVMKAISEEGSFTAAALCLGYSQPAISQMVRRLEQRTGTVLVERVGRAVRLTRPVRSWPGTPAGPVGARRRRGGGRGDRWPALGSSAAHGVSLELGHARAAGVVAGQDGLSRRLGHFTEAEPLQSLAALRAGECDLAVAFADEGTDIGRGEEDMDLFTTIPLLDDEVRLAVPSGHPLAEKESVSLEQLKYDNWIAGCPRCRGRLLQLASNAGFSPHVAYETEDYVAVMGLVAEGLGVSLVPDLIRRTAHRDDVVALAIVPSSRRHLVAVATPDLARVPAVKATIDALVEIANAAMRTLVTV